MDELHVECDRYVAHNSCQYSRETLTFRLPRVKNTDMKLIFLLLADIRRKNEERMCIYIYI